MDGEMRVSSLSVSERKNSWEIWGQMMKMVTYASTEALLSLCRIWAMKSWMFVVCSLQVIEHSGHVLLHGVSIKSPFSPLLPEFHIQHPKAKRAKIFASLDSCDQLLPSLSISDYIYIPPKYVTLSYKRSKCLLAMNEFIKQRSWRTKSLHFAEEKKLQIFATGLFAHNFSFATKKAVADFLW